MRRLLLSALLATGACGEASMDLDAAVADSGPEPDGGALVRDGGPPARDAGPVVRDAGPDRDGGPQRDGGPPRDGGTTPRRCDLALAPIFGGGTSTSALDGRVVVFAVEVIGGAPVVDATVVIETGSDVLMDSTDGAGCVDFVDPRLAGPVTLSVYARGHVYRTIHGFDRDRVTLPIHQPSMAVLPASPGRVVGIVDGWSVLTSSTA